MNKIKYNNVIAMKIAVVGSSAVGKTSICTRICNNFFTSIYEPTLEIDNFSTLFKVTESEVTNHTYIFTTLEDYFGLNNPLLQSSENTISNEYLKKKRQEMVNQFTKLMFTSVNKRDEMSKEESKKKKFDPKKDKDPKFIHYENIFTNDKSIERQGFIFVCDITEPTSLEDLKTVIEKMQQIEKTSGLSFNKCLFINKIDRNIDKKKVKSFLQEAEALKQKYKIDIYRVSALNNSGIIDGFRKFLSKIHQQILDAKQNEGFDEKDVVEDEDEEINCTDKFNSCSRRVFCGSRMFTCGGRNDEDEEIQEETPYK